MNGGHRTGDAISAALVAAMLLAAGLSSAKSEEQTLSMTSVQKDAIKVTAVSMFERAD